MPRSGKSSDALDDQSGVGTDLRVNYLKNDFLTVEDSFRGEVAVNISLNSRDGYKYGASDLDPNLNTSAQA